MVFVNINTTTGRIIIISLGRVLEKTGKNTRCRAETSWFFLVGAQFHKPKVND